MGGHQAASKFMICYLNVIIVFARALVVDSLSTVKEFDFLYTAVSGVDSSQLLYGRPYGGCAILYRNHCHQLS